MKLDSILTAMLVNRLKHAELMPVLGVKNPAKMTRILKGIQPIQELDEEAANEVCHVYPLPALAWSKKYGIPKLSLGTAPKLLHDMAEALQQQMVDHSSEYKMLQHLRFLSLVQLAFNYEYDEDEGEYIAISEAYAEQAKQVLMAFQDMSCSSKLEKELLQDYIKHNQLAFQMMYEMAQQGFADSPAFVDENIEFAKAVLDKLKAMKDTVVQPEIVNSYRLMLLKTSLQAIEMALLCQTQQKTAQAFHLKSICVEFFGNKYASAFDTLLYIKAWTHSRPLIADCFNLSLSKHVA